MRIGIVESYNFSKEALILLNKIGTVYFFDEYKSSLVNFISDKEIIFIRLKYYLSKDIIKKSVNLKYICSPTTGLNHIDKNYCLKKNISIISLRNESDFLKDIRATSEHTLGLIIALIRNYPKIIDGYNKDLDRNNFLGDELYKNKIGIIGFGRIGVLLSKYLNSFDAKVFYYDKIPTISTKNNAIKTDSIKDLINKCEIICLCANFEDEIIIDKEHIDLMKNKFFVNTSRGELVDENYLLKKIIDNHFKGVAIDVIHSESKNENNLDKFLNISLNHNFIFTPHVGGATLTSINRTEIFITNKLINIIT